MNQEVRSEIGISMGDSFAFRAWPGALVFPLVTRLGVHCAQGYGVDKPRPVWAAIALT